jgi:hypothetical protein
MSCGYLIVGNDPIKNRGSMMGYLCDKCAKHIAQDPNYGFCLDDGAATTNFHPFDGNDLEEYRISYKKRL